MSRLSDPDFEPPQNASHFRCFRLALSSYSARTIVPGLDRPRRRISARL